MAKGTSPSASTAARRPVSVRFAGTADAAVEGSPVAEDARLQAKLIQVERDATAVAYRNDAMTDDAHRPIERELDLEDARRPSS